MPKKQSESVVEASSMVTQPIDTARETTTPGEISEFAGPDVVRCLKAYVLARDERTKLCRFLDALTTESLTRLGRGDSGEVSSKALYLVAQPGGELENASKWVSEAWTIWLKQRDELRQGLQDFASNRELKTYPWPERLGDGKGGAGRPTRYRIEARPLESASAPPLPDADIRYIRETTPKAAWWFFSREFDFIGWRRILFLAPAVFAMIAAILLYFVVWDVLTYQPDIPPGRLISMLLGFALFAFFAWRLFSGVLRLLEKRTVMAPDFLLNLREFGVQLELTRIDETPGSLARLGLVRYAATCPVCGAKVLLADGGREFHGRLIGRCRESPDEHIFTFDRVTRSGKNLRG